MKRRNRTPSSPASPRRPSPPPPPVPPVAASDAVRRAVTAAGRGASAVLAITASQRLLTFALNGALVRSVSADVLGFAANDMELMLSTIHFLSREGCRLVAMRAPLDVLDARHPRRRQQVVNLAWLPVPVGLALSALAAAVVLLRGAAPGAAAREERASTLVYCAAAAVEALAEPAYILCQSLLLYRARARTEIAATLLRCVATYALVVGAGLGPLAFALGQLLFAATLAVGFAGHLLAHVAGERAAAGGGGGYGASLAAAAAAVMPRHVPAAGHDAPRRARGCGPAASAWLGRQVGAERVALLGAFSLQGLVKHAATEADRLVLTALASRAQRGVYAVVTNYGSLAPRLLFAPLEEAERASLAKVLGAEAQAAPAAAVEGGGDAAVVFSAASTAVAAAAVSSPLTT